VMSSPAADGLPGGREAAGVTELGNDRDRGQRADPIVGHQRFASRLATRERAQLFIQRSDLLVKRVDHRQRNSDLLARALRQRLGGEPCESVAVDQVSSLWAPVVVEHRLDPLLPLPALLRKGVTQPHPCAEIEDVLGRDPRLRQSADHQQLAQMPGVRSVALGALLGSPPGRRLGRLGEMHPGAHPPQLLDHEPPARRRL
jgi:hypothetical protein